MPHRKSLAALLIALLCALAFTSHGYAAPQDDWNITTSDFHTHPGAFIELSDRSVTFTSASAKQTIPLEKFISANRTVPAPTATGTFFLLLLNGDRIVGQPISVTDEKLLWKNPTLGQIKFPLQQLKSLTRANETPSVAPAPKQDLVTLANGDTVVGVFTNCSSDSITIQTDTAPVQVPLASVAKVSFAAVTTKPADDPQNRFRISLVDGSRLTIFAASINADQLALSIDKNTITPIELPLSALAAIEQTNGPVAWLAIQQPTQNLQIPFIGGATHFPARFDVYDENRKLDHCISVQSYSQLVYDIPPGWASFRTQYAIDSTRDFPRRLADLTVRIKLDGKTVHERPQLRAGEFSNIVNLNLDGARQLTLEADFGNGGDIQDQLLWIQPALLRTPAATQPSP